MLLVKLIKDGKVQDINKAMLADSVGTVFGALLGTTTVTSYVESGAGVKAGGRTGMTSLSNWCFIFSMFVLFSFSNFIA